MFDNLNQLDYNEVRDEKGGIRYEREERTSEEETQARSQEIQERVERGFPRQTSEKREPSPGESEVTPPEPEPPPAKPAKPKYGTKNKIITTDEHLADLARIRALSGRTSVGIDPELLLLGTKVAVFHVEAGARKFGEYAAAMIEDLGNKVKPYLRGWYEGVRHCPGFDAKGMTTPEEIDSVIKEGELSMSNLERAITIAVDYHKGKFDKAGTPYILHPLRIMFQMKTKKEMVVAVLHDVVEDTPVTLEQLEREGFDSEIIEAVDSVTKRPGESYEDFVIRAASNPIGYKVKMADLHDNLDISRILNLTQKDFQRLSKYHNAIRTLKSLGELQKNDCNKITKIEIANTENDESATTLSAKISDNGELIIHDYFIGDFAQEVYSHDDSESFVEVKKDFKDTLLLMLLKERFQASSELREWLSLNNVPYDFETWP